MFTEDRLGGNFTIHLWWISFSNLTGVCLKSDPLTDNISFSLICLFSNNPGFQDLSSCFIDLGIILTWCCPNFGFGGEASCLPGAKNECDGTSGTKDRKWNGWNILRGNHFKIKQEIDNKQTLGLWQSHSICRGRSKGGFIGQLGFRLWPWMCYKNWIPDFKLVPIHFNENCSHKPNKFLATRFASELCDPPYMHSSISHTGLVCMSLLGPLTLLWEK